ncbi:hypothetical protein NGM10_15335 [Halorussus salilacus]|uniref:hypothetical protein n=1 Tax=Halorussus salilacus TaxID=2953750 RepID=UPI0020A1BA26|nr:hypothetical protein [Halorussus salilacus]USZ68091.1 hypothetical protein NGM10_15335 [Halorussus salilacus]
MARDDTAREHDTERSLLDRRSYLKLAGATAAAVAGAGASATAGASSYDTIEVSAGEKRTISVGDGETFENKLVDISADGASAIITATSDDFTIRNVAFKGVHPGEENFLKLCVPSEGSTGLVENVYFGDGAEPGSKGGIYVTSSPAHNGELTFRNLHVAHISNNALYGSGPGYKGQPGVIHVEDSYFFSSNISNVRLGSPGGTSHVRNTTVHVDDSVPGCDMNCSSSGAVNARGVWAWAGEVELHDCDVQTNDYGSNLATKDGGSITQNGSRIGSEADTEPPEGVPMSAEEAASGGSESGEDSESSTSDSSDDDSSGSSDSGTLLELVSNADRELGYEFAVEGSVRKRTTAEDGGYVAEDDDEVSENGDGTVTVTGGVAGEGLGDAFVVEGSVTAMDLDESNWTLRYGGEEVSVADLTEGGTSDSGGSDDSAGDGEDEELSNVIVFSGENRPDAVSTYEFSVSGDIEKDGERGSINAYDTVSGNTARGRIVAGKDAFRFSGSITDFALEGAAVVEVHDGSN